MKTRIDLDTVERSDVDDVDCKDSIECPYCHYNNIGVVADKFKLPELAVNLAEGSVVTCQSCRKMFHVRGMFSIEATTKPIENVICNDREFLESAYAEIDKSNEKLGESQRGREGMQRHINDAKEWNLYQRYIRPYLHNKEVDESKE